MAPLGGLTSGENWRSGTVTRHALHHELQPVRSLLCKSWDLTVVLRKESRNPCLLPWHGRREVPLIEEGAKSGNFNIQSKNCKKEKDKELGKIQETDES